MVLSQNVPHFSKKLKALWRDWHNIQNMPLTYTNMSLSYLGQEMALIWWQRVEVLEASFQYATSATLSGTWRCTAATPHWYIFPHLVLVAGAHGHIVLTKDPGTFNDWSATANSNLFVITWQSSNHSS